MATTFNPSINGYSITSLKMMEGEDGYSIRCKLYKNSKALGEFYDKGDGSMYEFFPVKGKSEQEIENNIKAELPPCSTYDDGEPMYYDIEILVNKLICLKDYYKAWKKKAPKNYWVIKCLSENDEPTPYPEEYQCFASSPFTTETFLEWFLKEKPSWKQFDRTRFKINVFKSEEDFTVTLKKC